MVTTRPSKILISPEEFRNILKLGWSDLTDAADGMLTRIRLRHAEQLGVVSATVMEIKEADRASLDQTSCERGLRHDHHGIEGRSVLGERVGDEAVIEGVTHRRVQHAVECHHPRFSGIFVFVAATSRDLHQQVHQPW